MSNKPSWCESFIKTKPPYVIAEAGVNHNGCLETAYELIDAAVQAGADAVKFQAFSADELTTKSAPKADYQIENDTGSQSQYDMLKKCELREHDLHALFEFCQMRNIDFLATPFSTYWLKVLCQIGMESIKIGSGNTSMHSLLKEIGQTRLPVILSTGMSLLSDIEKVIVTLTENGCGNLAVLHCVSLYPTSLDQANLYAIGYLHEHLGLPTGFSDHTLETETGALAVAAGATILEKHFTLDKSLEGPDHKMSLSPAELKDYIYKARQASIACGQYNKSPLPQERFIKEKVHTSIVAQQYIKAGSIITEDMLTEKRPGNGIPSEKLKSIVGSRANCDIPADQLLRYDFLTNRKDENS